MNARISATFPFSTANSLFWQIWSKKNHNCQLKLKLGTQTNSIMQSSMFTFFVFDWNYPFCANLAEKIRIVNLSWKVVPKLIWIGKIQWWRLFVLDWKYPFWINLVQNIKLVSLSWNLMPRLIGICRIQLWCLFFLF